MRVFQIEEEYRIIGTHHISSTHNEANSHRQFGFKLVRVKLEGLNSHSDILSNILCAQYVILEFE